MAGLFPGRIANVDVQMSKTEISMIFKGVERETACGKNVAGKILLCLTGKGGTIAPFLHVKQ